MAIETKFNIREVIFFLNKNTQKIENKPVESIRTESWKDSLNIDYWVKVNKGDSWEFMIIKEEFAFKTKEELIKSLEE